MRKSSIVLLAVGVVLLIYLVTVVASIHSTSHPEFTAADATDMLNRLGHAFESSNTEAVLSFAAPDAKVAGRDLEDIRKLLHQAFANLKDQRVEFRNVQMTRDGAEKVNLHFDGTVVAAAGGYSGGGVVYSAPMGFKVARIAEPRLGGLMTVYEWKITDVEAPHLPEASF